MKTRAFLPLVTYPEPNADAVAAHAAALARWVGADLHALALNADIPSVSSPLSRLILNVPGMIQEAEQISRKHGERLLETLAKLEDAGGVEITTNALTVRLALLSDAAALHARYFDLALIGWEGANPTSRATAEAVIFGSGRPTVLLPELSEITTMDHVAIAWDGSRVAARAVGDALPFLQRASRISVLTIHGEKPLKENDAGERLAGGLQKRGLPAEAIPSELEDTPIAQALQQRALELSCNLLVMGAYGHSRLREFILGGATDGVLGNALLPVLLSH